MYGSNSNNNNDSGYSPYSSLPGVGMVSSRTAWEELNVLMTQSSGDIVKELFRNDNFAHAHSVIINRFIQYLMTTDFGTSFFRTDSHSRYLSEDLLKTCQNMIQQIPMQNQIELDRLRQEKSLLEKQLLEMRNSNNATTTSVNNDAISFTE